MDTTFLSSLAGFGESELRLTLIVCGLSLVAVWWPLTQGALLCWRARAATRLPKQSDASQQDPGGRVASLVLEVATAAANGNASEHPQAFVHDAAKQLVVDDYESSFAQPISMYANILPPIGFIGTTCGLAVLLLSMRISHDMLQMGALALALSSTIFALIGYATLESMKIHLYGRLSKSIDAGLSAIA